MRPGPAARPGSGLAARLAARLDGRRRRLDRSGYLLLQDAIDRT